jgi:EmrB/QacA subfamily drug resistance transporter
VKPESIASGGGRVPLVIPLVIACGMFMSQLDSTIIATSTPQMALSLGVNPLLLNIAITSYLISMAVFIPISGWFADRFGPRRVFCGALVTFLLGSVLCGFAESPTMLIAARVIQGMGGAMMTPVGRLILVRSFPKAQLVTAMNYVSMPALIGPMLGPLVGGALTTYLSWRWIFYINVPIGALGFVLAQRFVPDLPVPPPPRFDFRGFVIAGASIAALTVAIESLGRHVFPLSLQACLFAIAVLLTAAYVWHARRVPNPVIGAAVFRVPSFRIATTSGGLSRFGIGAVPFLLPLLFQIGFGLDPLHSGLLTFVTSIGAMVNKTVLRKLLRWFGLRSLLFANGLMLGGMICGLALLQASTPHAFIWAYLLLFGFVRSVQLTSVNALGYAHLTPELMSKATSIASVAQQLSMSLGVSIGAMLLSVQVGQSGHLVAADFPPVFLAIGILPILASIGFLRLAHDTGADVTGHASDRSRREGRVRLLSVRSPDSGP